MPSTSIIVCYDGSSGARRAIEWAGSFLRGADIVVLHLWDSPAIGGLFAASAPEASALRAQAVGIADEGVALARDVGLQPRRLVVGTGVSWKSILHVADDEGARLIVLGSRGVSGLHAAALGSISHGVAHHARIPVVVVPPSPDAADDAAPAAEMLGRALSRLSGTRDMDALARYVISEAGKGRDLGHILNDSYVGQRADASALDQLFDRRDVVDALGRDAIVGLRDRIATSR